MDAVEKFIYYWEGRVARKATGKKQTAEDQVVVERFDVLEWRAHPNKFVTRAEVLGALRQFREELRLEGWGPIWWRRAYWKAWRWWHRARRKMETGLFTWLGRRIFGWPKQRSSPDSSEPPSGSPSEAPSGSGSEAAGRISNG